MSGGISVRQLGDIGFVGVIAASVANWLPMVATALSIAWFLVRFYDRIKYGPAAKRRAVDDD